MSTGLHSPDAHEEGHRTGPGTAADVCPACGAGVPAEARFCEGCGTRLGAPAVAEATADPTPVESVRRAETDLGVAATVSDRGRRRSRNEDAAAVLAGSHGVVAVVCDGVASTDEAHRASHTAALEAVQALQALVATAPTPPDDLLVDTFHEALCAAQSAVLGLQLGDGADPSNSPSTTLVAAAVRGGTVVVAGVGDSRAYWLTGDPDECRLLTVDDSWAQEQIAAGVAPDLAYAHPEAHTITRWIGDGADPIERGITTLDVEAPGHLVLCTDGLWNYVEEPGRLGRYAADATDRSPLGIARHLVRTALRAGGHDNISVAVIPVTPEAADTHSAREARSTTDVHPDDDHE
jgi:serine/threonine protein phosphatase PrpC